MKYLIAAAKIACTLSPIATAFIVSFIVSAQSGGGGQEALAVLFVFAFIAVIAIAVIGLIVSYVTRYKPYAERYALWGYAVPAGIFFLFFFVQSLFA